MSVDIDAMFSGMATAQMNGKGRKLGDGKYRVVAKSLKLKKGGFHGDTCIFEFEVLTSANEDHPPESSRSYTVNLKSTQAFGDIKAVVFATIMGLDPSAVSDVKRFAAEHAEAVDWFKKAVEPELAKKAGLEEDFIAGAQVDVEVQWIKTKNNHDFALHKWLPVPEEKATQAA